MRNLIELKFWTKFVFESEEKATQFVNESNIDLREVSERLKRLMPDDAETMPPLPPNSDGKRVDVRPSGDQEELCSLKSRFLDLTVQLPVRPAAASRR